MLKKILMGYLCAKTLVKSAAFLGLVVTGNLVLPWTVYLSSAFLIGAGYFLIYKTNQNRHRSVEYILYFASEAVLVLVNIAIVAVFSPFSVGLVQMLVMGTFLDVVAAGAVVVYLVKNYSYIKIAQETMDEKANLIPEEVH